MITTEDYVSYETAKLLKEKGFNEVTSKWYLKYKGEYTLVSRGTAEHPDSSIDVPTLQMTMKWLREKQIFITIGFCDYPALHKSEWIPEVCTHDSIFDEPSIAYSTYEEACEEAIKYCLENLI